MSETVFVLGAGFSGRAIAKAARAKGWRVFGTTRSRDRFAALEAAGAEPLVFDGANMNAAVAAALAQATLLVASIAPDETGDPALNAVRDAMAGANKLKWIGYLSTVGVYGDKGGDWVVEATAVNPSSARSRHRAQAEADWVELAARRSLPLAILRLSGIYGPGRNALDNVANGDAKRVVKPGQVFNRIHVDDIAGAALFLAERRENGVFNVTDDLPAPPQDVVEFAATLMGAAVPPAVAYDAAALSPMGRSFYAENKRVSNAKLKALGYRFLHPDFRDGLGAMWSGGDWRQ